MAIFTSPGCLIGNVLIYLTPSTGYYYAVVAEFIIAMTCGVLYMLTTGWVAKIPIELLKLSENLLYPLKAAIKIHFDDKLTLAIQFASCGTPGTSRKFNL